jgi:hypothetical protein
MTLPIGGGPGEREETDSPEHTHPDTAEWVLNDGFGNA